MAVLVKQYDPHADGALTAAPSLPSQVDAQQVITARTALLRAGVNMWRPLEVHWSEAVGADREVNKALAALLGAPHASESGDDDKASRSEDADEALLQQLENCSRGNSQAATTFRGTPGGTTGITALMMESQPLPNVVSGSSGIGRFRPSYEPGRASSAIRGFTSYRMAPPCAPLLQQGQEQAVQGPAGSQGQGQGLAGAAESQGSEGSRAAMVASQDVKVQVQVRGGEAVRKLRRSWAEAAQYGLDPAQLEICACESHVASSNKAAPEAKLGMAAWGRRLCPMLHITQVLGCPAEPGAQSSPAGKPANPQARQQNQSSL